jgi:hypothetical protein
MLPRLRAIDRSRLSVNDRLLLDAAEAVVGELNADPPALPEPPARRHIDEPSEPDAAGHAPETQEAAAEPVPADAPTTEDGAIPEDDIAHAAPAGDPAADDADHPETNAAADTNGRPGAEATQPATAAAVPPDDPIAAAVSDARQKLEAIDKLLGEPDS